VRFEVDEWNRQIRQLQKAIGEQMKLEKKSDKDGVPEKLANLCLEEAVLPSKSAADFCLEEALAEKARLERQRDTEESALAELEAALNRKLATVGNIVDPSVVDSLDEADNAVIRMHIDPERPPAPQVVEGASSDGCAAGVSATLLSHDQVLQRLDGYDASRGAKVAGHRGYFLKNDGVRLNQALIQYGLDFLRERQYTLLQTPFFMKKALMAKTAQLEDFAESLYRLESDHPETRCMPVPVSPASPATPADKDAPAAEDDKYLIATSEQPISAFHAEEWFDKPAEQLPLRYAGLSTCFRKEAGAHGIGLRLFYFRMTFGGRAGHLGDIPCTSI
jgi:seryl-tRNA synthetase